MPDAPRTCNGCGQPIPRTAKFASTSISGEQLVKLKKTGRVPASATAAEDGRYALTLCLNCRVELAKLA